MSRHAKAQVALPRKDHVHPSSNPEADPANRYPLRVHPFHDHTPCAHFNLGVGSDTLILFSLDVENDFTR